MDEVQSLQDEIDALHSGFSEELVSDALDSDPSHQLALQSSLSVLAERMATIRTKASGRGQLLEARASSTVSNTRIHMAETRTSAWTHTFIHIHKDIPLHTQETHTCHFFHPLFLIHSYADKWQLYDETPGRATANRWQGQVVCVL